MAIALETGKVDVSTAVAPNDVTRFLPGGSSAKGFAVDKLPKNQTDLVVFNTSEKNPFSNKQLRQAVCYAIDSASMVQGVSKGDAVQVKTFGNAKYGDYVKKWDTEDYYNYNMDKAKQLFAASGQKSGLNVKLMTLPDDNNKKEAQIIQASLKELGINVEIVSYESALFNKNKLDPTQFDLMIDQYASTDFLVNVWKLCFDNTQYKGTTQNFYKDDKLQQLLVTARGMDTHTPENVDAFHQYLKDIAIGYGMIQRFDNVVHVDTMTKVVTDARGFVLPGACEYSAKFKAK
jgi:ABC-type transport system substrate-binding protein